MKAFSAFTKLLCNNAFLQNYFKTFAFKSEAMLIVQDSNTEYAIKLVTPLTSRGSLA